MLSGASSAESTDVKDVSPAIMLLSGRWNAGLRLEIMLGVRTSTEGLSGAVWLLWCGRGSDWRSGKNVCTVRIGVRRRVFNRSEIVDGESVAIGADG